MINRDYKVIIKFQLIYIFGVIDYVNTLDNILKKYGNKEEK